MLLLLNLLLKYVFTIVIIWHIFNHVFSSLSNYVLIADINLILIASTASSRGYVPILKALHSITKNPIIFPVLDVLPLDFLKISGSHRKLMPLVSQLLLISDPQLVYLLLEIDLLLVGGWVGVRWRILRRQSGQRPTKLTNV